MAHFLVIACILHGDGYSFRSVLSIQALGIWRKCGQRDESESGIFKSGIGESECGNPYMLHWDKVEAWF